MKNKFIEFGVTDFKAVVDDTMKFTCYGNIKGNIDHALDRTLDGAYMKSIKQHKDNGTMPKMLWMHNAYETPVGKWVNMSEDSKGLFLEGQFADTEKGREIYLLMKDGALDSFSIGYRVIEEKWNSAKGCNDLIELDIKEVSWVTMACNEESLLQSIKSKLEDGEHLTKSDLRNVLRDTGWFSKRQIERITADYNPTEHNDDIELLDIKDLLENSTLFK